MTRKDSKKDVRNLEVDCGCQEPIIDFVLVHGLCGDQSDICWEWCNGALSKESLLQQNPYSRVITYTYCTAGTTPYSSETISDAATDLLTALGDLESKSPASLFLLSRRPVYFMGHSFGDLIVKKAFLMSRSHARIPSLIRQTWGMLFLGTSHDTNPHQPDPHPGSCVQSMSTSRAWIDLTQTFQSHGWWYPIVYLSLFNECECLNVFHDGPGGPVIADMPLPNTHEIHWSYPPTALRMPLSTTQESHHLVAQPVSQSMCSRAVSRWTQDVTRRRRLFLDNVKRETASRQWHGERRVPGTCEWVLSHEKFRSWMSEDGPTCLWISGQAGTGKSMLCERLLENISELEQTESCIIFSFLSEAVYTSDPARYFLERLLHKLEQSLPARLSGLTSKSILADINRSAVPMNQEMFQCHLRTLFRHIQSESRIFIIVDGTDDFQWIAWTVRNETISSCRSPGRSGCWKCCITSRSSQAVDSYEDQIKTIALDQEPSLQDDLERYAKSRLVLRCPELEARQSEFLAMKIYSRAEGMFLWVDLATQYVQNTQTFVELRKKLESLPSNLNGMYQLVLESIQSSDVGSAQSVFAWLAAASRPLSLSELCEALAVDAKCRAVFPGIASPAPKIESESPEHEMQRICKGMITVDSDKTVRLCHRSLRTYLLSSNGPNTTNKAHSDAHELLARTCLSYLNSKDRHVVDENLVHTTHGEHGQYSSTLEDYVVENWSFHCRLGQSCSKTLPGLIQQSLHRALQHASNSLPGSQRQHIRIMHAGLRTASHYGFSSLTQIYLEAGVDPDAGSCEHRMTPLQLAAANGHYNTAAHLLRRGGSPEGNSRSGPSPLHLAASCGSKDLVSLLLTWNSMPNRASCGLMPLHVAASSGHYDVVKMLVEGGATIDALTSPMEETPLLLAASHGHIKAVKILINAGAASPREEELCNSLVQRDYFRSWAENLLIDIGKRGPFVWEFETRRTAENDMEEMLSYAKQFFSINISNRGGQTPLHQAAMNGHEDVVRLLLEKGAVMEAEDSHSHTPLHLAAENGHMTIVKLLLAAGAKVSHKGKHLGPLLERAVSRGHSSAADLLMLHSFSEEISGTDCRHSTLRFATGCNKGIVKDILRRKYALGVKVKRAGLRDRVPFHPRNA